MCSLALKQLVGLEGKLINFSKEIQVIACQEKNKAFVHYFTRNSQVYIPDVGSEMGGTILVSKKPSAFNKTPLWKTGAGLF